MTNASNPKIEIPVIDILTIKKISDRFGLVASLKILTILL
jgi:hypothetical protein